MLLAKVAKSVKRQNLFVPSDTLIVGISGGADSTALLELLLNLPNYNLHIIAAHLNHSLRGAESDADEEFCRKLAKQHKIPFETRRIDVTAFAAKEKLNLEDAARQVRIDFFDELLLKYRAAAVVLAHHADDQVETVLIRFLRGSGMSGLSGMSYCNARGYVRPLLNISRADIEQYLRERDMTWCEDASNLDTKYLRNRIRHELLPLLEDYNPAIRSAILSTASIISGDEELLEELTLSAFTSSCTLEDGRVTCDVEQLCGFKPALLQRVLRYAYQNLVGNLQGVAYRHIEALSEMLISERPNARLSLPQRVTAVRSYGQLLFTRISDRLPDADFEIQITVPGCYKLPGGGSVVVELSTFRDVSHDSVGAIFDLEKFPFPWLLRSFRPGDCIQPLGISGHKKVKDIFIDRKIPASERKRIPLLFCRDVLVWVANVCVSELTRMDTQISSAVKVTWYNL